MAIVNSKFYQQRWFWLVIVLCVLIGGAAIWVVQNIPSDTDVEIARPNNSQFDDSQITGGEEEDEPNTAPQDKKEYTLGESFEASGFTIVLGANYKFETVDNRFSEYAGSTIVGIPFTETNNTDEPGSFNEFSIEIFAPDGTEVTWSVGALFNDSKVKAGSLLPGSSQTSYLYFVYKGAGDYLIYMDDYQGYTKTQKVVRATLH